MSSSVSTSSKLVISVVRRQMRGWGGGALLVWRGDIGHGDTVKVGSRMLYTTKKSGNIHEG